MSLTIKSRTAAIIGCFGMSLIGKGFVFLAMERKRPVKMEGSGIRGKNHES
jgi:hypothetical protein